jgi:hypothetical protein
MTCSNLNCEFFINHKGVEEQIGYNALLSYLSKEKIEKSFNESIAKKIAQYKVNINENTYILFEPVSLRKF